MGQRSGWRRWGGLVTTPRVQDRSMSPPKGLRGTAQPVWEAHGAHKEALSLLYLQPWDCWKNYRPVLIASPWINRSTFVSTAIQTCFWHAVEAWFRRTHTPLALRRVNMMVHFREVQQMMLRLKPVITEPPKWNRERVRAKVFKWDFSEKQQICKSNHFNSVSMLPSKTGNCELDQLAFISTVRRFLSIYVDSCMLFCL